MEQGRAERKRSVKGLNGREGKRKRERMKEEDRGKEKRRKGTMR